MQSKREYAISLGLAVPGRGRLSREAHAAVETAMAKGMTFDDSPKPIKVSKSSKPPAPVKVVEETHEVVETVERYPVTAKFKGMDNGKAFTLGAREICRTCMLSFTTHNCERPTGMSPSFNFVEVSPIGYSH